MGIGKIKITKNIILKKKMEYYSQDLNNLGFDFETISESSYDSSTTADRLTAYEPVPDHGFKIERVGNEGFIQKRRPGRLPARPDSELTPVEFERRERRRERNRHAAARCRDRRLTKVNQLQNSVNELLRSKSELEKTNASLHEQLRKLQFQLSLQETENEQPVAAESNNRFPAIQKLENLSVGNATDYAITFTPLLLDQTFNFPVLPTETIKKMRNDSTTEFNKLLNTV